MGVNWRPTKIHKLGDRLFLVDANDIIVSASDGDVLTWIASASAWQGQAGGGGGASSTIAELSSIGDVGALTKSAGDVFRWDGATWSAINITSIVTTATIAYPSSTIDNLSSIGDFGAVTPSAGDVIRYDGASWSAINITSIVTTATIAYPSSTIDNLSSIGDVAGAPAADCVLRWDGAAWSSVLLWVSALGNANPADAGAMGDILIYDGVGGVWSSTAISSIADHVNMSSINDVGDITPSAGDVFRYDGATWSAINITSIVTTATIAYPSPTIEAISSICNVTLGVLSASDILIYDGATWCAVAKPAGGGDVGTFQEAQIHFLPASYNLTATFTYVVGLAVTASIDGIFSVRAEFNIYNKNDSENNPRLNTRLVADGVAITGTYKEQLHEDSLDGKYEIVPLSTERVVSLSQGTVVALQAHDAQAGADSKIMLEAARHDGYIALRYVT